jgi:A/G-specific adenine glycosylase
MRPGPASDRPSFSGRLIDWQRQHGRHDLPWQKTQDAYRIWLSEIMLQQTQVNSVIPYYARFLERFPDIAQLAAAPVEAVLERWAGLGYYARARNLHRCAQIVVAEHGGRFPQDAKAIAELPGIGRSTAAAISAFAYGQSAAILDGNVKRVLTRCFGIEGFPGTAKTEKALWALAESLLPKQQSEAYTQGLMDLGATRCTRSKPFCSACPMHEICIARHTGRQAELPTGKEKKPVPERASAVLLLTDGQRVLLERRPPSGIWGGLLALPEVEASAAETFALRHGCRLLDTWSMTPLKHSFTHFRLTIHALYGSVEAAARCATAPGWEWLDLQEVENAALPTPIRKLLRLAAKRDCTDRPEKKQARQRTG